MRLSFIENMKRIQPGATVARMTHGRAMIWTITRQQRVASGVWLTLQHGRRLFRVHVSVCISGPDLLEAGLKSVALAPMQRQLIPGQPATVTRAPAHGR